MQQSADQVEVIVTNSVMHLQLNLPLYYCIYMFIYYQIHSLFYMDM
jgi:hypothetical protein